MTVEELLSRYGATNTITEDDIAEIQDNENLRWDLYNYILLHKNRNFILALLHKMTKLRAKGWEKDVLYVNADSIMFACYLLGLHGQVEDSLEIWKAKITDFDTHCAVDIELMVFAGVDETLTYLEKQEPINGFDAFEYATGCYKAGSFEGLENYFKPERFVSGYYH